MNLNLRIKPGSETATTVILEWDPVPGCEGYLFYDRTGKRVSRSFDPKKSSIKISKPGPWTVAAVVFEDVDRETYPAPSQPPSSAIVVAPRVAYAQGGSDARYCLWADFEGGTLRPGLAYEAGSNQQIVRDQVAQYDRDGLCLGSERSSGSAEDGIVGAREIDGRPLCSLPMTGDPNTNTGSWKV